MRPVTAATLWSWFMGLLVQPRRCGRSPSTQTSDLVGVSRQTWQASVDLAILRPEGLAERVLLVGFGIGAMLCMLTDDERFASLALINLLTWFADKAIFLAPELLYVSRNQYWPEPQPEPAPSLRRFDMDTADTRQKASKKSSTRVWRRLRQPSG